MSDIEIDDRYEIYNKHKDADFSIKMLIPQFAAGAIIGKKGEAITSMQKKYNAKLVISKNKQLFPVINDRYMTVDAPVHVMVTCIHELHQIVVEKFSSTDHTEDFIKRANKLRLVIPNVAAGLIIGTGGEEIKKIKETSGAFVVVARKDEDNLPERLVTIEGDLDQKRNAVKLILARLAIDAPKTLVRNINYDDYTSRREGSCDYDRGNERRESPRRSYRERSPMSDRGRITDICGSRFLSRDDVIGILEELRYTLRGRGFPVREIEVVGDSVYKLIQSGILDDRIRRVRGDALINGINTSVYSLIGPGRYEDPPINNADSFRMNSTAVPRPDDYNNNMSARVNNYNNPSRDDFNNSKGMDIIREQPRNNNSGIAYRVEQKKEILDVEDSLIGLLMGPQARFLNTLMRDTNTQIDVAKKGDFNPGTTKRAVTITGKSADVDEAIKQIYRSVMPAR